MKETESILGRLAAETERRGVACLLVGGWALNFHGVSRQTMDIDFMIGETDFPALRGLMEKMGFVMVFKSALAARFRHGEGGCPLIDFIFVEPETFGRLFGDARDIRLGGAPFKTPSLENLTAMKIHALKNNRKHRYAKDFPDIVSLISANPDRLPDAKIRVLCEKYGTVEIYEEIRKANQD